MSAATLVGRVVREGAWSNVVARTIDLPPDDAALARRLLYETVRNRRRIDRAITGLSNRPVGTLDDLVFDVIRVAFAEVLFGRAAPHAVAHTAVEATKELGHPSASGFVNALVRQLQRSGEPQPPLTPAEEFGIPQWVVDSLAGAWSNEWAGEFLAASHREAPRTVRSRRSGGRLPSPAVATDIPGVWAVQDGPLPDDVVVQDPASAAVALAVGVEHGDRVLDMAASPGGKALALSDAGGWVVAVDNHRRRVRSGARRTAEAGFSGAWVRADGTSPPFAASSFTRVLLDAPCTGLGTLRRRPELRDKVTKGERDRLAAVQRLLLDCALALVRPGGRVVYSVCTVLPEETAQIVAGRGGRPPAGLPGDPYGDGLILTPHRTGTDGMFICVFDR